MGEVNFISTRKIGIIMIVGRIDERNKRYRDGVFFVFTLYFFTMWKTVKYNKNGFVCLVQPLKNHFMEQIRPKLDRM